MRARQIFNLDEIFPPLDLRAPPVPLSAGTFLLMDGSQMSGNWTYNMTAELADFYEANTGRRWIIPMECVVAYSPGITPTSKPAETSDAQDPRRDA